MARQILVHSQYSSSSGNSFLSALMPSALIFFPPVTAFSQSSQQDLLLAIPSVLVFLRALLYAIFSFGQLFLGILTHIHVFNYTSFTTNDKFSLIPSSPVSFFPEFPVLIKSPLLDSLLHTLILTYSKKIPSFLCLRHYSPLVLLPVLMSLSSIHQISQAFFLGIIFQAFSSLTTQHMLTQPRHF